MAGLEGVHCILCTHGAATDDDFQLFCHDQIGKAALAHHQVKALLESFEFLVNARVEDPVSIEVHKLLQKGSQRSCD